ncbi:unnamed protein product [Rotaria sordida]|uniref:Uncharacterized protein n=2 Tax=Rotaria sordida TaxID=392033 RepID=A0A815IC29_9BILA|nr:unnamed protein product [Rotaria sordida]CAF3869389.1 unnamed protein product [Rotaria sordida]
MTNYKFIYLSYKRKKCFTSDGRLVSIKNDLDFPRRRIQLTVIEPLDENRLNKLIPMTFNSFLIGLKYVRLAINNNQI